MTHLRGYSRPFLVCPSNRGKITFLGALDGGSDVIGQEPFSTDLGSLASVSASFMYSTRSKRWPASLLGVKPPRSNRLRLRPETQPRRLRGAVPTLFRQAYLDRCFRWRGFSSSVNPKSICQLSRSTRSTRTWIGSPSRKVRR